MLVHVIIIGASLSPRRELELGDKRVYSRAHAQNETRALIQFRRFIYVYTLWLSDRWLVFFAMLYGNLPRGSPTLEEVLKFPDRRSRSQIYMSVCVYVCVCVCVCVCITYV